MEYWVRILAELDFVGLLLLRRISRQRSILVDQLKLVNCKAIFNTLLARLD